MLVTAPVFKTSNAPVIQAAYLHFIGYSWIPSPRSILSVLRLQICHLKREILLHWPWLVLLCLFSFGSAATVAVFWECPSRLALSDQEGVVYIQPGLFRTARYPVRYVRGRWCCKAWRIPPATAKTKGWSVLLAPGGEVFLSSAKSSALRPARQIEGEWRYFNGEEWTPLEDE